MLRENGFGEPGTGVELNGRLFTIQVPGELFAVFMNLHLSALKLIQLLSDCGLKGQTHTQAHTKKNAVMKPLFFSKNILKYISALDSISYLTTVVDTDLLIR